MASAVSSYLAYQGCSCGDFCHSLPCGALPITQVHQEGLTPVTHDPQLLAYSGALLW
jgi:hypothetical protein